MGEGVRGERVEIGFRRHRPGARMRNPQPGKQRGEATLVHRDIERVGRRYRGGKARGRVG